MRSLLGLALGLGLGAACTDGTEPRAALEVAARLRSATVDSGDVMVVTLSAANPGTRTVRVTTPTSCVATARVEDQGGRIVGTPTIICSPAQTHYTFLPGDTTLWDIGVDLRSRPGAYRVVALLTLGDAASLEDTLPLTIQ